MKEAEKQMIKNIVKIFIKEYKKLPLIEDLIKKNKEYAPFLLLIQENQTLFSSFKKILKEVALEKINNSKTKTGILFREKYNTNKKLFDQFLELNLDFKNKDSAKFYKSGNSVSKIIQKMEEEFFSKMESGKYADYTSAMSEKFYNHILQIFPLYYYVGIFYSKTSE